MKPEVGVVALCSKGRPGLITGRKALPWGDSWVGIALDDGEWRWASRTPNVIAADLNEYLSPKRSKWALAWVLWLVAFLAVEVPAAIRKAKLDTLSEHTWLWFKGPVQKGILAVFLLTLTAHLVLETPGGWAVILTGAPVGAIIARGFYQGWRR